MKTLRLSTILSILPILPLFLSSIIFAQSTVLPGVDSESLPAPSPDAPMYQQTGEQYRIYEFPGTGEPIPFRLFVPEGWTPEQKMPILVTLRAGNSINNNHRGNNDLIVEARARGYIVISPLGYRGYPQPYYGSPYPVNRPEGPSNPADGWTDEENQRAEQDVINTIALVLAEYNGDLERIFIHGQNPSASAAFHFAAKYPDLVRSILASAGPIVTEDYPFENLLGKVSVMMIHGDQDTRNTIAASQNVTRQLQEHGIESVYATVPGGEHLTAYLTYASEVFDFFDSQR